MGVEPLEVYISRGRHSIVWTHTEEGQCSDDTGDSFYRADSDEQLRGEEDEESYAIQIGNLIEYHFWVSIQVTIVVWTFERVELSDAMM
jgi:hypothetical protein